MQTVESSITGRDLLARAIQAGQATPASASLPAPPFARLTGDQAVAVPLMIGGKAVAVLYADTGSGSGAPGWSDAIDLIVRHASAVAALQAALRTFAVLRGDAADATAASGNGEESARRYARLLVSEIKLYNEAAVRTGREQRDLRQRLRGEIDRALRLYEERVPAAVGAREQCSIRNWSRRSPAATPRSSGTDARGFHLCDRRVMAAGICRCRLPAPAGRRPARSSRPPSRRRAAPARGRLQKPSRSGRRCTRRCRRTSTTTGSRRAPRTARRCAAHALAGGRRRLQRRQLWRGRRLRAPGDRRRRAAPGLRAPLPRRRAAAPGERRRSREAVLARSSIASPKDICRSPRRSATPKRSSCAAITPAAADLYEKLSTQQVERARGHPVAARPRRLGGRRSQARRRRLACASTTSSR